MDMIKMTIAIIIIFTATFSLLYVTHKKRKRGLGELVIDTGNKDRDIGLEQYHDDIDSFLNQMRYTKGDENYSPSPLQSVFGGDVSKSSDNYSIELRGPYHIIKIIEGILTTPGSKFKAKRL